MKKQLILTLIMTSLFTQNINSMAFFKKNPSKALLAAVKKADYENVKKALDQGALLDLIDKHGRNAFELALESAIKKNGTIDKKYAEIAQILAPHATNIEDTILIAIAPYYDITGEDIDNISGSIPDKPLLDKNTFKDVNVFLNRLRRLAMDKENIVNN